MAVMKTIFDPAAHLEKQGWKGRGTALKHGHATRPLPVVQKKTLSGIGKDRDAAVPFWDHIFAATAASLFIPSAMPSPTPSTSKWVTMAPASTPGSKSGSSSSTPQPQIPPKLSINASTRVSRDLARRQLYSRFLRGKVLLPETEEEVEETEEEWAHSKASFVRSVIEEGAVLKPEVDPRVLEGKSKGKGKEREESREQRKARKTAKRAEREARKAAHQLREGKESKGKDKDEGTKKNSKKVETLEEEKVGESRHELQISKNRDTCAEQDGKKNSKRKHREEEKEARTSKKSKS
ncbi:hypothetical protein L204_106331 [Cryptococcus depauperatus]|nr:hypothetical protein L204_06275 [Cryptococcus depauperatus CBS 7855]